MHEKTAKKILIIPDIKKIAECVALAEEYNLGFEYNDFFLPDVLDSQEELNSIIMIS